MIYETIMSNIKDAMRDKNVLMKNSLKSVQSRAQLLAKDKKCEITDEIVVEAINKELKQLNETVAKLEGKEDSDLYKETMQRIVILKSYLSEQMSEDDIITEIKKIISENEGIVGGKLIGVVMKSLKGKADNSLVKACFDKVVGR